MSRGDPLGGAARSVSSAGGLALRLARAWWRQLAALAAACGVVAAMIAGALGVGDALEGGLRRLALERLGGIVAVVTGDDFFDPSMIGAAADGGPFVPAIVLEATFERASAGAGSARATLLACDAPERLGFDPPAARVGADEVAINDVLAAALSVDVGDTVVLRVAKPSAVPADSPLGRRTPESIGRRLRVAARLPSRGVGRFSLRPVQVTGGVAVTSESTARDLVRRGAVSNVVFATGEGSATALRGRLRPGLADYGLSLEPVAEGGLRLSSRKLLLPQEADRAAEEVLRPLGGVPTLAFLATALVASSSDGGRAAEIPYSTVLGVDATTLPVGALEDADGRPLPLPPDDGIILDAWAADDLAAQGRPVAVGDAVEVRLFHPETIHGRVEETSATLRVSGIARMRGAAVVRGLVPDVEGITDEKSIADWDPPFPFDRSRVRTVPPHDEDDRYWKDHGTTPKAFVSLACARRLAGSRFGSTTAWFVPPPGDGDTAALSGRLAAAMVPARMGIRVDDSRADALAAARGSTPFGGLFLALSSFVIAAGLILEWLLFRLLVAARKRDIGILAAVGWSPARVARLLVAVAAVAAVAGVTVGTLLGPAWAGFVVRRLADSWDAAVSSGSAEAFGDGTVRWSRLLPAAAASIVLSLGAIGWAARRAARGRPLDLLRGASDEGRRPVGGSSRRTLLAALAALAAAFAAGAAGGSADAGAAVGLFFLAGLSALVGLLALVRLLLGRIAAGAGVLRSLPGLAWRGLAHRPSRAFAIAAIVAVAEFLIVSVSAFSLSDPPRPRDREGPTGGWTSIASFASPSAVDPRDPESIAALGLSDESAAALAAARVERLRSSGGDDASCTNLYAPARPVVLGVGPGFVERGGFRFTGHLPLDRPDARNPWLLLGGGPGPVRAILDDATARWALKLGGVGARFTLPDEEGAEVEFEIAGLLEPGVLQGFILVAESDFQRLFPSRSGYSMALVDAGDGDPAAVDRAVRAAWIDSGVSIERAVERWRRLAAVQNTFLAAFQALGTLGLLLGTAGVAAVQIQGVLERMGSFGLLAAVGFPRTRLQAIVVAETLLMVGLGLAAGALAGAATLPAHAAAGRAAIPLWWIVATCGLSLGVTLLAGVAATRSVARLAPREALAARN